MGIATARAGLAKRTTDGVRLAERPSIAGHSMSRATTVDALPQFVRQAIFRKRIGHHLQGKVVDKFDGRIGQMCLFAIALTGRENSDFRADVTHRKASDTRASRRARHNERRKRVLAEPKFSRRSHVRIRARRSGSLLVATRFPHLIHALPSGRVRPSPSADRSTLPVVPVQCTTARRRTGGRWASA